MKAEGGGAPTGKLADAIAKDFGSLDEFKKEFATAGNTAFGSGWAWLCKDSTDKLVVTKTIGAGNPIVDGMTPILTMDGKNRFFLCWLVLRFCSLAKACSLLALSRSYTVRMHQSS